MINDAPQPGGVGRTLTANAWGAGGKEANGSQ